MTENAIYVSLTDILPSSTPSVVTLPFYSQGTLFTAEEAPRALLTLLPAGSMRFRWNEVNANRGAV